MSSLDGFLEEVSSGDAVLVTVAKGQYLGVCTRLGKRTATFESYDLLAGKPLTVRLDVRAGTIGGVPVLGYRVLSGGKRGGPPPCQPSTLTDEDFGPMFHPFSSEGKAERERRRQEEPDEYGSSLHSTDEFS